MLAHLDKERTHLSGDIQDVLSQHGLAGKLAGACLRLLSTCLGTEYQDLQELPLISVAELAQLGFGTGVIRRWKHIISKFSGVPSLTRESLDIISGPSSVGLVEGISSPRVVEVLEEFVSNGKSQTILKKGLQGTIMGIDDDGEEALIDFGLGKDMWVFKKNFHKLEGMPEVSIGEACSPPVSETTMSCESEGKTPRRVDFVDQVECVSWGAPAESVPLSRGQSPGTPRTPRGQSPGTPSSDRPSTQSFQAEPLNQLTQPGTPRSVTGAPDTGDRRRTPAHKVGAHSGIPQARTAASTRARSLGIGTVAANDAAGHLLEQGGVRIVAALQVPRVDDPRR